MPRSTIRPPRLLVGVAAMAVTVLALSGCSAASGDVQTSDASVVSAPAEAGALPATLTHVYGETVVEEAPERVITIGWATQDIVAALGTVPVAQPATWGGDEKDGVTPWFRDQVEVLGGELPEILEYDDSGELDFEQILTLEPDLILAPYSGVTEKEYERLSEIAPTVAYATKSWSPDSWQDLVTVVGTALGQPSRAAELVEETEGSIAAAAAAHPEFAGTTFAYARTLNDGATDLAIYIPSDPRVQFLLDLGLTNTPAMGNILGNVEDDGFFGTVSLEELDTVPADVFVGWSDSDEALSYTMEHPTFQRWQPIASGHYYWLEDPAMGMATNAPTPLSVPWALETFVPALSSAIAGTPVGGE